MAEDKTKKPEEIKSTTPTVLTAAAAKAKEEMMRKSKEKAQSNLEALQSNMQNIEKVAEELAPEIQKAKDAKAAEEAAIAAKDKPHPEGQVAGVQMARTSNGSLNGRNGKVEVDDPVVNAVKNNMKFSLWTWPSSLKFDVSKLNPQINPNSVLARIVPAGIIAVALFLFTHYQMKSNLEVLGAQLQQQVDDIEREYQQRLIVKDSVILSYIETIQSDSITINDQIDVIDALEDENYDLQLDLQSTQDRVRQANQNTAKAQRTLQDFQRDYEVISNMNETLQESLITHKVNTFRLEKLLAQGNQKRIIEANGLYVELSVMIYEDSLLVIPTRTGYSLDAMTSR